MIRRFFHRLCHPCLMTTVLITGAAVWSAPGVAQDDGSAAAIRRTAMDRSDLEARRLLRTAVRYIEEQEAERGIRAVENLLQQYPESEVRFEAHLVVGRHLQEDAGDPIQAIEWLTRNRILERREQLNPEQLEILLESLYLLGVSYYHTGQYPQLFSTLRRIVTQHPNSVWANQAYYYLGMAHFAQQNWPRAIEYLSLVGTFVDPEAPTAEFVEAGRRFYVKVQDGDLPTLVRLTGQRPQVRVTTSSGDVEFIRLSLLSSHEAIYIGSIATAVGMPQAQDGTLQVLSGDTISVEYIDENTQTGERNVPRQAEAQVVSSGTVSFVKGTLVEFATAVFTGQDLFVNVRDADLDVSDRAETVTVRVVSRYVSDEFGDEQIVADDGDDDPWGLVEEEETGPRWVIRDEVALVLRETVIDEETGRIIDSDVVRSGNFVGSVRVEAPRSDGSNHPGNDILTAMQGDEVVAYYVDEMHIGGAFDREVTVSLPVVGEFRPELQTPGGDSGDTIINARKNLTEGQAYLELARIFKDMGLIEMASTRVQEGLSRAEEVLVQAALPPDLRQRAFRLRWELYLADGNTDQAIATLTTFNEFFPHSAYADQAMLSIGRVYQEQEDYTQAVNVFQRVLAMENSMLHAEAQFRIAQAIEASTGRLEPAIGAYRAVANQHGDSRFAGEALAKLVNYHTEVGDYAQAIDLLEHIFMDHPDEEWLDGMLHRWVVLAYNMGNYRMAMEKAQQLILQYPNSARTREIRSVIPRIQQRLNAPSQGR